MPQSIQWPNAPSAVVLKTFSQDLAGTVIFHKRSTSPLPPPQLSWGLFSEKTLILSAWGGCEPPVYQPAPGLALTSVCLTSAQLLPAEDFLVPPLARFMVFKFSPEKPLIYQFEEFGFLSCTCLFWIPHLWCSPSHSNRGPEDRAGLNRQSGQGAVFYHHSELLARDDHTNQFVSFLFSNSLQTMHCPPLALWSAPGTGGPHPPHLGTPRPHQVAIPEAFKLSTILKRTIVTRFPGSRSQGGDPSPVVI